MRKSHADGLGITDEFSVELECNCYFGAQKGKGPKSTATLGLRTLGKLEPNKGSIKHFHQCTSKVLQ